ncbi:MAG: hypothetical protein EP348_09425 [Alphaproteobacteria bacterium]|nr:MAG: hypothetical protein EP348_09425 [Alphaproteobacteria bacterium]
MFDLPVKPDIHAFDHFCDHFDQMLETNGTKVFAELAAGPLTYDALARDMRCLGALFVSRGLDVGDRVLVASREEGMAIRLFLALLRAGMTPVIADAEITGPELVELLEVCGPAALVADENMLARAELGRKLPQGRVIPVREVRDILSESPDPGSWPTVAKRPDVALLVLTSGTTSTPKAVELTHRNLIAQLIIFQEVYGFDDGARLLNLLPLHHVDGLIRGPLSALWFGGFLYRGLHFSVQNIPQILKSFAEQNITHFITVPAMLRIIARVGSEAHDTFSGPDFRFILCSADFLDAPLWRHVEEIFKVPVVNAYGLSEVVCDALFAGPDEETRRIGSLGRPHGCRASVLDDNSEPVANGEVGELVLAGPTVMRGYFNAPEITAKVLRDGAFHTGDFVRVGPGGLYEFVGRKKTAIVSAGATIHPESVAAVLLTMPGVAEAAAFGVPDVARGEKLVAAIVPEAGQLISSADAAAFCREHLSAERRPAEFLIVTSLPRGASGKILMAELMGSQVDDFANIAGVQTPDINQGASLEEKVCQVAAKCFNADAADLSADSTPFNTDGWDSLAHMTLIEELELVFDMQFSAAEIASIASLGDAMEFIQGALDANG